MNPTREDPESSTRPIHRVPTRRRTDYTSSVVVRGASFDRYIRTLQKLVHPSCHISSATLTTVNAIVNDVFDKIAFEARELAKKAKRSTLLYEDVVYACRLLFTKDLFDHVDRVGSDAVTNYRATLEYEDQDHAP